MTYDAPSEPRSTDPHAAWLPWVVVALVTSLYLLVAPTWVLGGDNGEFSTLGFEGGVAHPSGYPLYVLYLRAMSWLPGSEPAHTAALATALLAAPLTWALQRAARAWGASSTSAAVITALFATGPLPLLLFTQAEVFALNSLFAALIVLMSADEGPLRGAPRAGTLALLAGLALSNHLSSVWLAPIGLYGFGLGVMEAEGRQRWLAAALGPVAFAAGLLPYLTLLPMADGTGWVWGQLDGLGDVLAHATRREYGSLDLAPEGTEGVGPANLGHLLVSLGRSTLWAPPLVGLAAAGIGVVRPWRGRRGGWIALALTLLAAGPAFIAMFNILPEGVGLHVVQRFHVLPALLLAVPTAVGLDALARKALAQSPAPEVLGGGVVAVGLVLVCGTLGAIASLDRVQQGHSPAVARYLQNTLEALPPNTALIGKGDHRLFGVLYTQHALGLRPDVVYIDHELLVLPWYQERVSSQLGHPIIPPGTDPPSVRMVGGLLASGRPVVLTEPFNPRILSAFPSYPEGTGIRVLPPDQTPPPPSELFSINTRLYAERFVFDYTTPHELDDWDSVVHLDYHRTWHSMAAVFDATGDPERARTCHELAQQLAPWMPR